MSSPTIRTWAPADRALSESDVRAAVASPEGHRFFANRYDAGTRFEGHLARPAVVWVLEGTCTYRVGGEPHEVAAGQRIDLPPGRYGFQAAEAGPVRIVKDFLLPATLRGAPGNETGQAS